MYMEFRSLKASNSNILLWSKSATKGPRISKSCVHPTPSYFNTRNTLKSYKLFLSTECVSWVFIPHNLTNRIADPTMVQLLSLVFLHPSVHNLTNGISETVLPLVFLKSPFIPPIFFTIWANLVYWESSSWTSRTLVPDPRATRTVRPGCLPNSFAP